jgi:putative nucleotidyltransferase with HDIG domain
MADKIKLKTSRRIKLLLGFLTVALIVLMFPKGESIESEVTEGTIWIHNDLIAPFTFPIIKDYALYSRELNAARKSVYPVFERHGNTLRRVLDSLKLYNTTLLKTIDSSLITPSSGKPGDLFLSDASLNTFKNLRKQERNLLATRSTSLNQIFSFINEIIIDLYKSGIVSHSSEDLNKDSIAVRMGNIDIIEPIENFLTVSQGRDRLIREIKKVEYGKAVEDAIIEYAVHFVKPDLVYSRKLTNEEIDQAENNVSKYSGFVTENERIIAKHDRITKETKLKIESYKIAKGEKSGDEGFILQILGKFLHVSFLISLLTIYIFLFRKRVFSDNQKILLLSVILLFVSLVTFLINQINVPAPLYLLIFIPAASMLITIIFDSRLGFYYTVILTLITGALRGNDYVFTAMNLFAGALSVYTVRDIKNRSQIFRSFLYILVGYTTAVIAFALEQFADAESILIELSFVASNALVSPVLTYGLLIFFERFFGITTDLTLLELSNFDRPLLKELARKAPGTFNHSMTMGTLAETAAERIGANPLLARVGAYYHDIGKTLTPQNFVENQLNNQNIHENLSPEESVSLISKHIKEGKRLAHEQKLPEEIVNFIPMHHGTLVMPYFYEKAKKLYGEEKVNIEDYKYHGPIPNSKETAIVMLADGCESAVRAIEEPDQSKVENVIENIIQNRIADGQLDDSPLTFKDISRIKEAFISILLGQHHRRIRYPMQEEMEKGVETAALKTSPEAEKKEQ